MPSPGSGHRDDDGIGDLGFAADGDDGRGLERRVRLRGDAIERDTALAESCVVAAHGLDGDAVDASDLDGGGAVGDGGAVVQTAQAAQRGEAPHLVASGGNLERVHVERREDLTLVGCRLAGRARFSPRTASWTPVAPVGAPVVGMFFASAVI